MDEHEVDAIAYPASTSIAANLGGTVDPLNCETAPYEGLPVLVVPAGASLGGLPLGIELLGRPFSETTLISLGAGYEALADHRWLPATTPPLP
jgi:amidase/aspartyl-tRNA(Asn)/glutamyl-tRNA(Gln) amidotransferase subunit A